MDTKDKLLIEKQKELICLLHNQLHEKSKWDEIAIKENDRLMHEIAALDKQVEEQESNPVYDEAYLNECIAKATPNLSKIKDVDKHLAEIRGEQESKEDKYCKRLAAGRDFLMTQDPRYLTVEDCLEAFGFSRGGLNEIDDN